MERATVNAMLRFAMKRAHADSVRSLSPHLPKSGLPDFGHLIEWSKSEASDFD
jgi:hypothetical protein